MKVLEKKKSELNKIEKSVKGQNCEIQKKTLTVYSRMQSLLN